MLRAVRVRVRDSEQTQNAAASVRGTERRMLLSVCVYACVGPNRLLPAACACESGQRPQTATASRERVCACAIQCARVQVNERKWMPARVCVCVSQQT